MAEIRLSRGEVEHTELPLVCICCGAPAVVYKSRNFAWHPSWVWFLVLAGLLPLLIVALILTKRMRVKAPFCMEHKYHWLGRTLSIGGSFVGLAVLGILSMILFSNLPKGKDWSGYVCVGFCVLLLFWLVAAIVVQSTSVRPDEITDHSITLKGVSPEFVESVRERRDAGTEGLAWDDPALERFHRRPPRSEDYHDRETGR